jgi:hypothetical protein
VRTKVDKGGDVPQKVLITSIISSSHGFCGRWITAYLC